MQILIPNPNSRIDMAPLLKKMNYKEQSPVLLAHAPESFAPVIRAIQKTAEVHTSVQAGEHYEWLLIFAEKSEVLADIPEIIKGAYQGDVLLWVAYPKKSSRQYRSDIHRYSPEWKALGNLGFEGVRQVAIDEDWSALRFRQVDFIKSLKRDPTRSLSEMGKKRTTR